jgi:hypothetical protein
MCKGPHDGYFLCSQSGSCAALTGFVGCVPRKDYPSWGQGRSLGSTEVCAMVALGQEVLVFLKAVLWQWWCLMSCAFWTFAGIAGQALHKNNEWYVKTSIWLGVFVLCISLFQAWRKEYSAKKAFLKPIFDLRLNPRLNLQRDQNGWDAWYCRVAVTNNQPEDVALQDCRLVLEDWTFESPGLNQDTAFPIKDESERQTTIVAGDTKQFDMFVNVLVKGTNQLSDVRVKAPNVPFVTLTPGPYSMILRLTGNLHTKRYRTLLILDSTQGMRITRIDEF